MLADTKVQVPDAATFNGVARLLVELSGRDSEDLISITTVDDTGAQSTVAVSPHSANLVAMFLIDAARTIEARTV